MSKLSVSPDLSPSAAAATADMVAAALAGDGTYFLNT